MTSTEVEAPDRDLLLLVDEILGDLDGHDSPVRQQVLWATLTRSEIQLIGLPISRGGAGGTLADLLAVVMACARHGQPVPLVENHLAQLARVLTGGDAGTDLAVLVPRPRLREGQWLLSAVGWARAADELLLLAEDGDRLLVADRAAATVHQRDDLAGEPADDVLVPAAAVSSAAGSPAPRPVLSARRTLLGAAQIAGAIRGCYELTRTYAAQREQFGKTLNAFPEVQRHLVELAQAAAITQLALWRAAREHELSPEDHTAPWLAKVTADLQAAEAIRCAHQVHGAMGMTREYPLHRLTRRLHAWSRDESGARAEYGLAAALVERGSLADLIWSPRGRS